jgi:GNAT superfamily N-acetyltransferase
MGIAIECSNAILSIELLTTEQLYNQYLPLRFDVLHSEYGYDHGAVNDPAGFLDRYDRHSIHYGVFQDADTLLGAARVIIRPSSRGLPSYQFIAESLDELRFDGTFSEISRVLVDRRYRGLGLFRPLFITALLIARDRGVDWLIISERVDKRFRSSLLSYQFREIASDYWFHDEKIAPTVKTASYILDVNTELTDDRTQALVHQRDDLLLDLQGRLPAPIRSPLA